MSYGSDFVRMADCLVFVGVYGFFVGELMAFFREQSDLNQILLDALSTFGRFDYFVDFIVTNLNVVGFDRLS